MTSSDSTPPSLTTLSTSVYTTPPTSNPPTVAPRELSPPLPPTSPADHRDLEPDSEVHVGQKRTRFAFSLRSDELHASERLRSRPSKKAKVLCTTVSVKRSEEVEDLHSLRMLQLARASREAFAARVKFRRLRVKELDVMRTIAYEEYEEAQSLLRVADRQIGDVRHTLASTGPTLFEQPTKFPLKLSTVSSCSDVSDVSDGSDVSNAVLAGHSFSNYTTN